MNINDQPVIVAAVGPAKDADPAAAAVIARTELLPMIKAIPGVSSADLTGGTTRHLVITLDPAKMADAGVSLQQVQGLLQANQLTVPAGSLTDGQTQLPVTADHHYQSVAELQGQVDHRQAADRRRRHADAGDPRARSRMSRWSTSTPRATRGRTVSRR